jgi:hypothetical protein
MYRSEFMLIIQNVLRICGFRVIIPYVSYMFFVACVKVSRCPTYEYLHVRHISIVQNCNRDVQVLHLLNHSEEQRHT